MRQSKFLLVTILSLLFLIAGTLSASEKEDKLNKLAQIKQLKSEGEIVYALVPKTINEPFFKIAGNGCIKEAKKIGVNCIFYGSTEQNMRNQVKDIKDLIAAGIDGISIAGVKKGYISSVLGKKIKKWGKPIISFDSPLNKEISKTYIGTNNYLLGKALGKEIQKFKPNGGIYCIQTERPDSPNHNDRMKGIIDGMTNDGKDNNKWKKLSRCPLKTMGDFELGVKQMSGVLNSYKLDVFASTGGGPQFLPKKYRKAIAPFQDKIKKNELIFANIDTISAQLEYLKEGISSINVGQKPYEMGEQSAKILKMITDGKTPPSIVNTGLTYCNQKNFNICTK